MISMLEIPSLLYILLIQLAAGIVLACQFAPGSRQFMRQQFLLSLTFLVLAPIIDLFAAQIIKSQWTTWTLYCASALGVGLIAAFWLKYQPDAKPFEKILDSGMALVSIILLYVLSKTEGSTDTANIQTGFFLYLGSSLLLGAIWTAMAYTRVNWADAGDHASSIIFGRLFFLALSGFALSAIFIPLAMPLVSQPQAEAPGLWHAWHEGLGAFAILTFFVALYQCWLNPHEKRTEQSIIPGLSTMAMAFTFAMLGEVCGRVAFLLNWPQIGN